MVTKLMARGLRPSPARGDSGHTRHLSQPNNRDSGFVACLATQVGGPVQIPISEHSLGGDEACLPSHCTGKRAGRHLEY